MGNVRNRYPWETRLFNVVTGGLFYPSGFTNSGNPTYSTWGSHWEKQTYDNTHRYLLKPPQPNIYGQPPVSEKPHNDVKSLFLYFNYNSLLSQIGIFGTGNSAKFIIQQKGTIYTTSGSAYVKFAGYSEFFNPVTGLMQPYIPLRPIYGVETQTPSGESLINTTSQEDKSETIHTVGFKDKIFWFWNGFYMSGDSFARLQPKSLGSNWMTNEDDSVSRKADSNFWNAEGASLIFNIKASWSNMAYNYLYIPKAPDDPHPEIPSSPAFSWQTGQSASYETRFLVEKIV